MSDTDAGSIYANHIFGGVVEFWDDRIVGGFDDEATSWAVRGPNDAEKIRSMIEKIAIDDTSSSDDEDAKLTTKVEGNGAREDDGFGERNEDDVAHSEDDGFGERNEDDVAHSEDDAAHSEDDVAHNDDGFSIVEEVAHSEDDDGFTSAN